MATSSVFFVLSQVSEKDHRNPKCCKSEKDFGEKREVFRKLLTKPRVFVIMRWNRINPKE